MNTGDIVIAIGTLRPPKVEAVRTVVERVKHLLGYTDRTISYIARDVISGVAAMPLSVHEIRRGALNRAHEAKRLIEMERGCQVDFAIGLEGGLFILKTEQGERVHLQSWAYVEGEGEGHYGSSMSMPLPNLIAHEVIEERHELGVVIDKYSGRENTRSLDGAFGFLSQGLLSRQQAFELALLGALAPFYHRSIYRNGKSAS